ncbi:MAG: (2Fe-2S)-binding protein [Ramlibacter sp.]|nr:(2Fe-2S)-binding protein [Ramlibacter sp.]
MRFTLNGSAADVDGDPNAPLLYLLRNDCGAKGVRFGCGQGNCGACTVLIDGHPQQSCTMPNWSAVDRQVTTTEGLAADPVGAIVLQAFLEEQAAQCGYCINGIMVSLTGLLKQDPGPGDAALKACLNRHLCRCGTHLRILRAAHRAIARLAQAR